MEEAVKLGYAAAISSVASAVLVFVQEVAPVWEMPALVPDLHTYDGLLSADMLRRETGT